MKKNNTTTICWRKDVEDEVLELPLKNHLFLNYFSLVT